MEHMFQILLVFCLVFKISSHGLSVVFSWKQISYNFDGVLYAKNSDYDRTVSDSVHFADDLEEAEKFFIQYNNVPIGFEVYRDIVFVNVPRRRHGIPSTLNYVTLSDHNPVLRPYPDVASRSTLVSVYRPRIDECGRLWMVDTGLLEVPGERKQIQPPAIVVYDLNCKKQILRYQLKSTDLIDERTPAGLTSITVDVGASCEDTHAYITDLATNELIVFSLKKRDSWRIQDDSFRMDEGAMNFTVAGERKQIQPPAIVVYDLNCKKQILRYQLKSTDLIDERTPAGLTSITVDVGASCEDTHAYITDLATNELIVFSLKKRDSWRIQDDSFRMDEGAMNFTVAGHVINWRDGLFNIVLSHRDAKGSRTAFFHPLVSTQEYSVNTAVLKSSKQGNFSSQAMHLGTRGPLTQSGSHDYHNGVLFFANVAQDGVLCWNTRKPLTPENVVLVAQDHKKLVYISDLKVKFDEVWVLVNQIPRFIYDTLDPGQNNFYILKGRVQDLIQNTKCA